MNRLRDETSPYLRQHADNPVDWLPFSAEAFARARELDRPLLVSIGYSACHWCHVMAHESFEDEEIAGQINDGFVAVKVDREERPDVDAIYMDAVQALTGQGGWPLNVFCTPDGRPFFGGTYFPKRASHGMASFPDVLSAISDAWVNRRAEIDAQAEELTDAVGRRLAGALPSDRAPQALALVDHATERIAALYDSEHPGFGQAPKFPQAPMIELLLHADHLGRPGTLEMATSALQAMASGGIYDHLGGGFARYSVDSAWQVPHFEKMLYDQAALARAYLHAFQVTGDSRFFQVLAETIGYVLRELRSPEGGLYSSQDADSEGEEGRFYVWTKDGLVSVLGDEGADSAASWYGVTERGNFEDGRTVLHRPVIGDLVRLPEIEAARAALFAARAERVPPATDDKVLCEWNAMTAAMLAEAAAATGREEWGEAAVDITDFLLSRLRRPDGRWLRSYAKGRAANLAVAADYAWLVDAFTRLGELTGKRRFTDAALDTAAGLIDLFSAPDGGWFTSGADADPLVVRARDLYDGVTPAAGSVAASALARLGAITGEEALIQRAEQTVAASAAALSAGPAALCHLVEAAVLIELGAVEVVVVGNDPDLVAAASGPYEPARVLVVGEETPSPLLEGRDAEGVYVCRRGVCLAPVKEPAAVGPAIAAAATERAA